MTSPVRIDLYEALRRLPLGVAHDEVLLKKGLEVVLYCSGTGADSSACQRRSENDLVSICFLWVLHVRVSFFLQYTLLW